MRREVPAIILFQVEGVVVPEYSNLICHVLFGRRTCSSLGLFP